MKKKYLIKNNIMFTYYLPSICYESNLINFDLEKKHVDERNFKNLVSFINTLELDLVFINYENKNFIYAKNMIIYIKNCQSAILSLIDYDLYEIIYIDILPQIYLINNKNLDNENLDNENLDNKNLDNENLDNENLKKLEITSPILKFYMRSTISTPGTLLSAGRDIKFDMLNEINYDKSLKEFISFYEPSLCIIYYEKKYYIYSTIGFIFIRSSTALNRIILNQIDDNLYEIIDINKNQIDLFNFLLEKPRFQLIQNMKLQISLLPIISIQKKEYINDFLFNLSTRSLNILIRKQKIYEYKKDNKLALKFTFLIPSNLFMKLTTDVNYKEKSYQQETIVDSDYTGFLNLLNIDIDNILNKCKNKDKDYILICKCRFYNISSFKINNIEKLIYYENFTKIVNSDLHLGFGSTDNRSIDNRSIDNK